MPLALLLVLIAAAVAALFVARPWWFPVAITAYGHAFDAQFSTTLWITGVIFVLAQIGLAGVLMRYRDRGRPASFLTGNLRLELAWTAATAVLFLGLMAAGQRLWASLVFARPDDTALRVEVSAKQFAWAFRYPGPDGKFGRTDLKWINDAGGNPFGLDEGDPAGADDVVSASLVVPAGRPVRLTLNARDVIHNFFVPELRLKQDAVPGMLIPYSFTAETAGSYEIACSELCGLGHHQMRAALRVVAPAEFERWLAEQAPQK